MTVMNRLYEKALLRRRRDGRAWSYRPATSREAYAASTMREALHGARDHKAALLHFFADLAPDDAAALRRLVQDGDSSLCTPRCCRSPGTGAIYECVRRHLEALADDAAVRAHGRRPVGLALGRIALASYPAAGLGASGAAVWRVQRLVAPIPAPAWRARLLLLGTTFSLAAGLVLVAAEAASALGPVADPSFCPLQVHVSYLS